MLAAWRLKETSLEAGSFTGKTRITINAPAAVVLKLVSRPEYKAKTKPTKTKNKKEKVNSLTETTTDSMGKESHSV
jgi:hypothetical protein